MRAIGQAATVEISGYSHFFGFDWGMLVNPEAVYWRLLGDSPPLARGHGNCQNPRGRAHRPGIFRCCHIQKGDFTQEGQHRCLVQERKAKNEECP